MTEDELPRRNPMCCSSAKRGEREREREGPQSCIAGVEAIERAGDETVIVVLLWLDFREGLMRVSGFVARGGNSEKREMALKESAPLSLSLSLILATPKAACACLIYMAEYIKM